MKNNELENKDITMPVIFLGHGSPMNAITENQYSLAFRELGKKLPTPKSILVISAHWMTNGSWVTHMENPKTIHDFYGFPDELFNVQYPAPGDPKLAENVKKMNEVVSIGLDDHQWGLDHGTWSVLKHVFPKADIPVIQLSLDMKKPMEFHFELGQKLKELRKQGVLILGSGNIVHNLRSVKWDDHSTPYDWSIEFDKWIESKAINRDFESIIKDSRSFEAGRLSIPTLDHYLPLLYILGAANKNETLNFDVEGIQNGSISMRSLRFG